MKGGRSCREEMEPDLAGEQEREGEAEAEWAAGDPGQAPGATVCARNVVLKCPISRGNPAPIWYVPNADPR
jgi:hypothetical protein